MPPMKMKSYATFDDYLADQKSSHEAIIRALRDFVRRTGPRLTETVKWGNGCWVNENGPVAYVHAEPDYVQFGFFRGATLKDPKRLLNGQGQYVRHIKVRDVSAIDERSFGALLRQAARAR